MEETDKKIVNLLIRDGRIKYRDIANKLKISTSTAFLKLNKLFSNGSVERIVPIVSDKVTGLDFQAVIAMLIEPGFMDEAEKNLSKLRNVNAVYDVTGEWDVIMIAKFSSRQEMDIFVKDLGKIPHVKRTNTFFVLNKVKEDFVFFGF